MTTPAITEQPPTAEQTQAVVRRWLVRTGDIEETVEAGDPGEAMAMVFTMFDDEDEAPEVGTFISCVEVLGDEVWWKTEEAIKRAGRWGGTDAGIAEKSSAVTLRNDGSKASAETQAETCILSE